MQEGLAGKGILLTQISLIGSHERVRSQHHLGGRPRGEDCGAKDYPELQHRSMIVKKLNPLPSKRWCVDTFLDLGWKAYQQSGKLFEYDLPEDLLQSSQLPRPLVYADYESANSGHDMPIDCI